ncbi:MAG: HPr-rel-A system PqqD family peptide chaperone [Sutterellaceae bacterium]|nr:HPr-rel-A system PqqD family peptide chaperone [Burkholderiaceae bacterium]MCX7902787.1 HPr-rel-A system PqqD family peptide chaperone [Burkholderiaceae bacterium]MDW8429242.1 HPr-rel-A system PqqD family peptide chaperone [Sutterellaceae bacterium]
MQDADSIRDERRYVAAPNLKMHDFDDEVVVFDPLSWDAHVLNAAAAAVLEFLRQAPRTVDDVTALLRTVLREQERTAAAVHARDLLSELSNLCLVRVLDEDARVAG